MSLRRACQLDDAQHEPSDAASFNQMIEQAKTRLGLIVQEVARVVMSVLSEWQNAQKKWAGIKTHAAQYKDIGEQIARLTQKGFIEHTP